VDAIELLRRQHRDIERLFAAARAGGDPGELFDALALHAALEEQQFYPATRAARTDDELRAALEEHLAIKQMVADLLARDPADADFDAKLAELEDQVKHHVAEEEAKLFPAVERMLAAPPLHAVD
jgi:hypothetical protein